MGKTVLIVFALIAVGAYAIPENAHRKLSPSLEECYESDLVAKWNLLPHSMETLITIIRKIEESPNLNMDVHALSAAILHRFRQDGIEWKPNVKPQRGILPYGINGHQFYRHSQLLKVIPGDVANFPNSSLSLLERCTLHSMISSSFYIYARGDEGKVCGRVNNPYRRMRRSVDRDVEEVESVKDDAVTLTPEQVNMLMHQQRAPATVDPNSFYPAFPPNHPDSLAKYVSYSDVAKSECPIENGVVKTRWGSVSGGAVIAGIAAGLKPQQIMIRSLIEQQDTTRNVSDIPVRALLDARFLATLAGDLAEVGVMQGPSKNSDTLKFSIGVSGNWNSTSQPLYYFLSKKEDLEMTSDEIRGGLDGLVLANLVDEYARRFSNLKLSQVLDMYYSNRGLFKTENRACNRKANQPIYATRQDLETQAFSAGLILTAVGLSDITFSNEILQTYAVQTTNDLLQAIPSLPNENSCDGSNEIGDVSRPAVDLTILVETNWQFETLQSMIAQVLDGLEVSKFGSNVTVMSAFDGSFIVNSTNSISDFYSQFNSTQYAKFTKGFDLPRAVERLRALQNWKLDEEKRLGWAGGRSDVVLIIPQQGTISQQDKDMLWESFKIMKEEVPDATVLFLTYGSKDRWSDLVLNPAEDIVSIIPSDPTESYPAAHTMQTRIKQVPRRLINTQCGSNYEREGVSKQVTDYVSPGGTNFHRIHANYFMTDDTSNPPKIKIQNMGSRSLKVCSSRELLHVNASSSIAGATCNSIGQQQSHTMELNCDGASYLHECKPYFISVSTADNAVSTNNLLLECTDFRLCRYPDDSRYTFSFENLICKSGASTLIVAPLLLLTIFARFL